jgi:acetylornithine deacetylase/succinyl-diaminopimelate desuccinylase-like protein
MSSHTSIDPVEILQTLIRFDTTNPPGNEINVVTWIREQLEAVGIPNKIVARESNRPNLIARIPGSGYAPPLLLYGHLDVVTTQGQDWQYPPFDGQHINGYIWGRGALDMKAGIAMCLTAFIRAHIENASLGGDVILACLADEGGGGDCGARHLVEEHKDLFDGVNFVLGEFGGFSYHFAERKYYPIMVAEKQICVIHAVVRGPGGHGSLPPSDGAMNLLAKTIQAIENTRLPVHITAELEIMVSALKSSLPSIYPLSLGLLLNPRFTNLILKSLGSTGLILEPLVRNTVNATMIKGGEKLNVIPSEIHLGLDGRLLPGFTPQDMLAELKPILSEKVELTFERYDPGPSKPDLCLIPFLKEMLVSADPQGIPIPFFLAAVSDARFFSQIGIQTYGFVPMNLPQGFEFPKLIHAANERIPVDTLNFGTSVVYNTLFNFGGYVQ